MVDMEVVETNLRDKIADSFPQSILWDNLDNSVVGITSEGRVVYSIDKMILHFMNEGMNEDESIEWIEFNILNQYIGEYTPLHILDL